MEENLEEILEENLVICCFDVVQAAARVTRPSAKAVWIIEVVLNTTLRVH
jgi:hypothetical protein